MPLYGVYMAFLISFPTVAVILILKRKDGRKNQQQSDGEAPAVSDQESKVTDANEKSGEK